MGPDEEAVCGDDAECAGADEAGTEECHATHPANKIQASVVQSLHTSHPTDLADPCATRFFLKRVGGIEHVVYNRLMRALVKTSAQPGLTATDRPDPKPGPTDAIIRVTATSLCGTDAHIYNWDPWAHSRIHPPRIIGHEMCGEVVDVGSNVTLVKVGDYVAAESHLTCGHCFQCRTGQAHVCKNYRILGVDRDGSFAEYVGLA